MSESSGSRGLSYLVDGRHTWYGDIACLRQRPAFFYPVLPVRDIGLGGSKLKMETGRKCQVITHLRQGRLENENENEDQGQDSLLLASGSARLGI
jgi:hypothetical protein